ncbi:unnamed protein product [Paramecium sonneborni]|uniref:Uncharacterized protein n=1 Tax=Paramecium sonneborni TaxID=65129 RepID=A0A8S1R160_9CILI|nr:unnamed protein product [Paramecium sonneborni]
MERQQIQQSMQLILPNFLYSHPNANLSTILDFIIIEGINQQSMRLFTEYVTQDFQQFWEMLLIINFNEANQDSRYPFIVTEIIKKQSEMIFDFLFQLNFIEQSECIEFLFQTLDNDFLEAPNAAYFSKFVCSLIDTRGIYLLNYLILYGKYIIDDLIKHIDNNHIANIIYNLIGLINKKGLQDPDFKQQRIFFLQRIICILQNKYYDSQIVENISNIIINLLENVNELEYKKLIFQSIYYPETFFMLILQTKSVQLVDILILLLRETLDDLQFNYQSFQIIGQQFVQALKMENNQLNFMSTYGQEQEILGQTKLKLIEFYYNILQTENLTLIQYFDHQEIQSILMQFIQKYEFNNSLQNYYLQIIFYIFNNQNLVQIQQTIFDMDLLGFLCLLNTKYYKQVGKIKKPITKGYQGMANKLTLYFQQVNYTDQWNNYKNNHQSILDLEINYLLGIHPTESHSKIPEILQQQDQKKEEQQIQSNQTQSEQINEDQDINQINEDKDINQINEDQDINQINEDKDINQINDDQDINQINEDQDINQINDDQFKIAIDIVENNFQDHTNIGEILSEQLLHQVKKNKNISKSGLININADNDPDIRFCSKSLIITDKKKTERKSSSQEKVNQIKQ